MDAGRDKRRAFAEVVIQGLAAQGAGGQERNTAVPPAFPAAGLENAQLRRSAARPEGQALLDATRAWAKSEGLEIIPSCCFSCNTACELLVFRRKSDGRVVKIEGDPSSPVTKGVLCPKGLAAADLLYNSERLKKPLRRVGPKDRLSAEPVQWEEISWDEALDEVAGKILGYREREGARSVAFLEGTRRGWSRVYSRLSNAFGTPNHGAAGWAQCLWPRLVDCKVTFGAQYSEACDFPNTNCVLVWGSNPPATWPILGSDIMDAMERGAKLIVVDPRLSETAAKADLWMRLKPGTDTDLALGMLHVIVREELYDKDFVKDWTSGFEHLAEDLDWRTPAITETLTGVPADMVVQAARLFALSAPACISRCVSVDQTADSIQTCRALSILSAITGNVDVPGGNVAVSLRGEKSQNTHEFILADRVPPESLKDRSGYDKYPLLCGALSPVPSNHMPSFWEQVASGKPYSIKAALIFGSNAAVSYTNSRRVKEGIGQLEFLAVCDQFMTETATMADIVLPASSWLERENVISSFQTANEYTVFQRPCATVGESRSDVAILGDLAERLGLGELFWKNPRDLYDHLLGPTGLSFVQALEKRRLYAPLVFGASRKSGFKTPSGKVEVYSSLLKAQGIDPIPRGTPKEDALKKASGEGHVEGHVEGASEGAGASEPEKAFSETYPFAFSTGARSIFFRHTENRRNPWLIAKDPRPLVYINTSTAAGLGIADGDLVEVFTQAGTARLYAKLEPEVAQDFIQAVPGWEGKGNINYALGWEYFAQGIGTVPMRGLRCGVRKVSDER